jgi:dimethylamine monooxygenase subunit A
VRRPPYEPWRETSGVFRWRLGVRPLDMADWIEIDEHHGDEIAAKARIMATNAATALVALDDAEPECAEVADALAAHLRQRFPEQFAGLELDASLHPLDAIARQVQEDLVVMAERDGRMVFVAGSVCFPNRWDLRSKLGRTMSEVHEPVALLNEQLEGVIDDVLRRLSPDRPMWRLGWGVIDTDDLYQPLDGTAAPRPVDAPPAAHHLRIERETLTRHPNTGCILFTIRTHQMPLPDLRLVDAASAAALADAIASMPDPIGDYKQLRHTGPAIAAWLRSG